ncbi:MAG: hypothetical protein ACK4N5_06240, partial [Myxococcales bacterium]
SIAPIPPPAETRGRLNARPEPQDAEPRREFSRPPGERWQEEPAAPIAAPDGMPRPPLAQLSGAGAFTWRTYRFCPEVQSCEQTPPAGSMAAVKYSTDRPYSGFLVGASFFPLRNQDNAARGLGVAVGFGRSLFLRTRYLDKARQEQVFGSTQQRLHGELVYRWYYRIDGMGDGYLGARLGYLSHLFMVDENPKIVDSRRGGLTLAAEAALPINRFLSVEGRFAGVPLASPGEAERKLYGSDASGGGFALQAGFSSDLGHPEWHVEPVVLFDMIHFGDRYANTQGGSPRIGRALEDYYGLSVGVRANF